MSNESVVANALKMSDTPDEGTLELDEDTAALLKLFEETEFGDDEGGEEEVSEDVTTDEGAAAPEAEVEDGEEEEQPEVAPPETDSAEEPPGSDTSEVEEPPAPEAEAPTLEIPEAQRAPEPETPEAKAAREKWRADALRQIEEHYAQQLGGDETRDQLLTEPEKALPKILANAYMDMYDSLMGGVGQALPNHVETIMTAQRQAQQYEQQFFTQWPALKEAYSDSEKQQVIQRAISTYRQMNPQAPVKQAIEEAGAMAMVALRLPVDGSSASTAAAPKETGFAPASPGGGAEVSAPPPAPKKLNEYEQLAQELIDDDEV